MILDSRITVDSIKTQKGTDPFFHSDLFFNSAYIYLITIKLMEVYQAKVVKEISRDQKHQDVIFNA